MPNTADHSISRIIAPCAEPTPIVRPVSVSIAGEAQRGQGESLHPRFATRRGMMLGGVALACGCAQPSPSLAPASVQAGAGGATEATSSAASRAVPGVPRIVTGDRWRYELRNLYNGQRTAVVEARVESAAGSLRVSITGADGSRRPDEVWADARRIVQEPSYDMVQLFTDPVPVLPQILEAGVRETFQTTYRVDGDVRARLWMQHLAVSGWERIRVPAGEFDALRVVRQINFEPTDPMRADGRRTDTAWYAPTVNRWVRREWTGSQAWSGLRRMRSPEDYVGWQLLDYTPAG